MIHFEDSQTNAGKRIAVGESVQTRAEDDALPNPARNTRRQLILGVATPGREEGAPAAFGRFLRLVRAGPQNGARFRTDDAKRQRIFKNLWLIKNLVRRAAQRYAVCCSTGNCLSHVADSSGFYTGDAQEAQNLKTFVCKMPESWGFTAHHFP